MSDAVAEAIALFREWSEPRDGVGVSPFRLASTILEGATEAEVNLVVSRMRPGNEPAAVLLGELRSFWLASRSARLFEDIDYGQWGLRILTPQESLERTTVARTDRPVEYRSTDLIVGEFLGDQELLVLDLADQSSGLLVALPLDERTGWYEVAPSLSDFLFEYLAAIGEKFWERRRGG